MDEYERLTRRHYGALEIKRSVGPNLIRGLVVSVMLHGALISLPFVAQALQGDEPPVTKAGYTGPIIVLPPFAKELPVPKGIPRPPKPDSPISKIFVPAPEEDTIDSVAAKTPTGPSGPESTDTVGNSGSYGSGGPGGEFSGFELPDDPIPPDTEFIPFEVGPQKLSDLCLPPEFPELAKIVGMKGKVTVKIYVDRFGHVKKWKIMQANPPDLGFEEAVLKVIPEWRFTPAIQQGHAVGVWVAVPFTFNYKK